MGELAATAVVMVLLLVSGLVLVDGDTVPYRPVPWCAVGLTALAVAGVVLQAVWPAATAALDADPARTGWWRHGTAVLLQNGGPAGIAFNLLTLAAVAALAEWCWGSRVLVVLVACAVAVPVLVGSTAGGAPADDPSTYAGSSGVTFFLGGTLAGALAVVGPRWGPRLLGLVTLVAALAAWTRLGDAHGLVAAEGVVVGALAAVTRRGTAIPSARRASRRPPPPSTPGAGATRTVRAPRSTPTASTGRPS